MDIKRKIIGKDKPLIIVFNSNIYKSDTFEMENTLKMYDEKCNIIFLRDRYVSWYIKGVNGYSKSYEETIDKLREDIVNIKPNKILTIGLSSGGFAALYFGNILKVDKIIACSPQIVLNNDSIKPYYKKLKNVEREVNILPINEDIDVNIFWCKFSDFYGITKRQNRYVEQNLNDEGQYNMVKGIRNVNNILVEGGNHGDIMRLIIKNGELFNIINKFIN